MKLRIKRVNPGAFLPSFGHPGDAGMDLHACIAAEDRYELAPGGRALIPTGLAIQLPEGFEAQIRPRSGLALKHGITTLNSPGTIDEGYRGEIGVLLVNHGTEPFIVTNRMKVAQLVVKRIECVEIEEVMELDTSSRGTGGFGSTGM